MKLDRDVAKKATTMKEKSLLKWISANALGLGVGFVAALQTGMFIQFGFDTEIHWKFVPPDPGGLVYAAILMSMLVGGAIMGSAQALILRSRSVRVAPWILSTTTGFVLIAAVEWPLMAANLWGRIPGPAEPIIIVVGGGSLAGILQYLALRRQGIVASKWLALWVGGLVASLVPTALLFMSLEGLGLSPSWPMEVFLTGFVVAGVAAWISGRALFAATLRHEEAA